ncbi:MAG: NAD-dependent epimerase/dehydratase family protein [Clostridiales bacterium]|nr:NAD-dependent epimerase/dehydratase family protein [Clostridiales bacterium]
MYESEQWISDIDSVTSVVPEINELSNKKILITGASGLIGSAVADILIRYNETHEEKITIYVAGRSYDNMKARFGPYLEKDYMNYLSYDATSNDNQFSESFDYIIHAASNATPNRITSAPVETMLSNTNGLYHILQHAYTHKSKRVLFVSSSEVYGINNENEPIKEGKYGYIDILNYRNSYSIGKRAAETLCASFYSEYGVDSVIVRPGHIYGPTADPSDTRVSSSFVYKALNGEDITLMSDGSQIRSYVYCLDCASAILKVLLRGEAIHAYNISNADSIISILTLSEIIASITGVTVTRVIPDDSEKKAFNPMMNSSLDSNSLEQLGWKGLVDADEGLRHTCEIIKNILK